MKESWKGAVAGPGMHPTPRTAGLTSIMRPSRYLCRPFNGKHPYTMSLNAYEARSRAARQARAGAPALDQA